LGVWILVGDGQVNDADRKYWVDDETVKNSWMGDADLNGEFNSQDFVQVLNVGKYETGKFATWEEGDWNADLRFTSGDLVSVFTSGGYELGPKPAVAAVPEPAGPALLLVGILAVVCRAPNRHISRGETYLS
jgi:hypothetical protein